MAATTRDIIDRQKERLEFIQHDTRQYEEKIADILRKIKQLEDDLFTGTSHGRQIPELVRENIGISVEVQFLEYEKDMRSSMNITHSRPSANEQYEQRPIRPSNPVIIDSSGNYPYARVIPNPTNLPQLPPYPQYPANPSSSGNSPSHNMRYLAAPQPTSQYSGRHTPQSVSPSTPTTLVYQNTPNTMVSSTGGIFNINPRGSISQVIMQPTPSGSGHSSPVPVTPERPNCLPLPARSDRPSRPAPPPPSFPVRSTSMAPPMIVPPPLEEDSKWACDSCSYHNHSVMVYCEMCNTGRIAPPIGNIYTTFSSLYPKEAAVCPASPAPSTSTSPKSPLPAYPPISPSPSLGSPPSSRRHKSRSHLVSFGKKRHSRHKDKRADK